LAVLAGTAPAVAAPVSPSAIKQATEGMQLTETVHCRPFRHWHTWGFSRGCGRVYFDEGVRVRRFGYREHYRDGRYYRGGVREGFRGEGRPGMTVGGERGSARASGSFRGNATGETTSRQGGGMRSGDQGRMNTAPTGGRGNVGGGANVRGGASGGANVGGGAASGGASGGAPGAGSAPRQ
jgi:hypothetical protein